MKRVRITTESCHETEVSSRLFLNSEILDNVLVGIVFIAARSVIPVKLLIEVEGFSVEFAPRF